MKYIFLFFITLNILGAKVIATIPEASGICYLTDSKKLIVVNDEGYIYSLNTDGLVLQKVYLGDYDFEGVSSYQNKLLVAVEDKHSIFLLNAQNFEILKKIKIKKHKKIKKNKKLGIEAIVNVHGNIYLSHQKSGLFKINTLSKKKASVTQTYALAYQDLSGLTFHKNHLYILSDKNDLLIKYDLTKERIIQTTKLPKTQQEGICFDESNNIYIADDNGYIHKYTQKELGL